MNTRQVSADLTQSFMQRVFFWMGGALALSGFCAYGVATSPFLTHFFFSNAWIIIALFIAQIGIAVVLGGWIMRLSYSTALALFLCYASLTGITLASIFFVYTMASIASAFCTSAALFLAMGMYGMITKRDLTSMGAIVMMVLFGVIIAMMINMFLRSSAFDYVISIVSVVIFSLLTAYDMQKLKQIGEGVAYIEEGDVVDHATITKSIALRGAFTLFLDFVNLFLALLHLLGNRRDK
jgi:FtsH-binding integral membrane protein